MSSWMVSDTHLTLIRKAKELIKVIRQNPYKTLPIWERTQ